MIKKLMLLLLCTATIAHAQYPITYMSYASQINVDMPVTSATNVCTKIPVGTDTTPYTVKKTFQETFDKFNLRDKVWTPHYDGGYNTTYKQWEGYNNLNKRRQPGMLEQQLYVDPGFMGKDATPLYLNPFNVDKGMLTIRAEVTPPENLVALSNFPYTSGVITTRKSHNQTYGYFEARIKVPHKQGLLPAFWMVNANRVWPPEIDIMEAPSHKGEVIQTTVHWPNATGGDAYSGCEHLMSGYSGDFHQYGVLWTPEKIVWYIDRVPVAQILTPPAVNQPMYMQLNLAVGGTWVGNVKNPSVTLPAEMVVDNVVAYSVAGTVGCAKDSLGVNVCK